MGQGRSYIRQQIDKHNECRNVAITKTNGDLMLYGRNGYAVSGCPLKLVEALKELNQENEFIDDVQLTENGSWLILYGDNGFQWRDIPYSLEIKIREYNRDGEVVTSVTFNDAGDWIVISRDHFSASNSSLSEWLREGLESYGKLWAACITDDAIVAVYANGYKFYGDVPYDLQRSLEKASVDVYRLKIAGDAWFFADINGVGMYRL